jgi:hypothetical protein
VRDIDKQLLQLREIEARIAFAEFYIQEQRDLVQRVTRQGFATSLAHGLLRSMQDSLAILHGRREDLLSTMSCTPFEPAMEHENPGLAVRPARGRSDPG